MNEAFVDFTGGVGEVLYLRQNTPGLFAALRHALAKESLVGATALVRAEPPYGPPLGRHGQGCGGGGGVSPLSCLLLLPPRSSLMDSRPVLYR